MDIEFTCPSCRRQLTVPQQYAGQQGTCPSCGAALTVPPASTASPTPEAPGPQPQSTIGHPVTPPPPQPYGATPTSQQYGFSAPPHEAGRPAYGEVPRSGPSAHPLAIASLVLGAASFLTLACLISLPGLICGIVARNRIREEPHRYGGDGLALAGVILSAINLALTVLVVIIFVLAGIADSHHY